MTKGRLEAFSDGVLAIIITIMVLEIKVPHGDKEFKALIPLLPVFFSYLLSFIYLAIYWNNHHHLLHSTNKINGGIMWANMHLLFWLSLLPFVTGWMGENNFAPTTLFLYGIIMVMTAAAYFILQNLIIKINGKNSKLSIAIGKDIKGKMSIILYLTAVAVAFLSPLTSGIIYALVAVIWLIPDRRLEHIFED
ncbi:MAG: DUF1211 domain-containing protein [Bacteroidetes bacterium]|nr:DUF1211 domain-containing protein [Bacteroidota bacterium]